MLVLSRKKDESIVILDGDGPGAKVIAEMSVIDIRGDKVRVGVVAPRETPVHRRELYEAIQRANEKSIPEAAGAVS